MLHYEELRSICLAWGVALLASWVAQETPTSGIVYGNALRRREQTPNSQHGAAFKSQKGEAGGDARCGGNSKTVKAAEGWSRTTKSNALATGSSPCATHATRRPRDGRLDNLALKSVSTTRLFKELKYEKSAGQHTSMEQVSTRSALLLRGWQLPARPSSNTPVIHRMDYSHRVSAQGCTHVRVVLKGTHRALVVRERGIIEHAELALVVDCTAPVSVDILLASA